MLFHKDTRLPIDAEVLSPSNTPDENAPDINTAVQTLIKSREKVFKMAENNISSDQEQQKAPLRETISQKK